MKVFENMKLDNSKIVHKDFYRVASHFLVSGTQEPIVLQGPKEANKESLVDSLAELMGQNPKVFDYENMSVDCVFYGLGMTRMLERAVSQGKFVVIKGLSQNWYDEIELTTFIEKYYCSRKNERHPEFRMLILRDEPDEKCYEPVYARCEIIKVSHDPLLEETNKGKNESIKVKDVK